MSDGLLGISGNHPNHAQLFSIENRFRPSTYGIRALAAMSIPAFQNPANRFRPDWSDQQRQIPERYSQARPNQYRHDSF